MARLTGFEHPVFVFHREIKAIVVVLAVMFAAGSLRAQTPPSSAAQPSQAAAPSFVEQEEILGEISAAANLKHYSWANQTNWLIQLQNGPRMSYAMPDRRRVVWFEYRGDHKLALLNGTPLGPEFDKNLPLRVQSDRDGKHLVIQGVSGKKGTIIFDGKELRAGFDEVFSAKLSLDGQKLGFGAKTGNEWSLLINGERRAGPFDTIPTSSFSADGAHWGYAAKRGNAWVLGLDGKEQSLADVELLSLWVTRSGHLVCAAKHKKEHFYVVDGKEGPHFDILGELVMSGEGGRYAYAGARNKMGVARDRAAGRLVVDGQLWPEYQGAVYNSLWSTFFSNTTVSLKEGMLPHLSSWIHGASDPVFSPDAQHVAYSAHTGEDTTAVLLGDKVVAKFDRTARTPLAFSPDAKRLAALGWRGPKLVEVRDGAVFAEQDNPDPINIAEDLVWSPDGQRTAFVMGHGGHFYLEDKTTQARRRVVVDGRRGTEYNCAVIANLHFSSDSKHWGYEVIGDEKRQFRSFVVVDGVEGKSYDEVIPQSLLVSERTVVYVAREGRKFLRVTRGLP
ncbi:MAG: hypothetical protein ACR2IF_17405 [Terriglobales bacterium]